MKRILCYGDSNTWGFTPITGQRYSPEVRWPGVLQRELGPQYAVLEDGISGRTTVWEDPYVPCRSGLEGIGYGLLRAKPIDLVILMLGTNDLYYTDAYGYYRGISRLTRKILNAPIWLLDSSPVFTCEPKILLVSPIALAPEISSLRPELELSRKYAESLQFARYTERAAKECNVQWVDAGRWACASAQDGIHFEPEGHKALGKAVAEVVREMIPNSGLTGE